MPVMMAYTWCELMVLERACDDSIFLLLCEGKEISAL